MYCSRCGLWKSIIASNSRHCPSCKRPSRGGKQCKTCKKEFANFKQPKQKIGTDRKKERLIELLRRLEIIDSGQTTRNRLMTMSIDEINDYARSL